MKANFSQEELKKMACRWVKECSLPYSIRVITDTTDFYRVDYNDVVLLNDNPLLVRTNAKEGRFGLDEQEKYWVKRAVDLTDGSKKIVKLVFYERFDATIGNITFECFRSPKKEARILELVSEHPNFMHGYSITDQNDNLVRILDVISGRTVHSYLIGLQLSHADYFYQELPRTLDHFIECVEAIGYLHQHGEKHGDIRRDHIIIDGKTGRYRWIDFDFNYRHTENIYGYDLFGLGNILVFIVGKGDVMAEEVLERGDGKTPLLSHDDVNIVFKNRVVNLRKIYPYIPESLNRIMMHFSAAANRFYENTFQLLEDLKTARKDLG